MSAENTTGVNRAQLRSTCMQLSFDLLALTGHQETQELCEAKADAFMRDALNYESFLITVGRDPNILIGAVSYLDHHHAIPPMLNGKRWFRNMLEVLIEIAAPNSIGVPSLKSFYAEPAIGVAQLEQDALDDTLGEWASTAKGSDA
jgi:hypothetical protein